MADIKTTRLGTKEFEPFGLVIDEQSTKPLFNSDELVYWRGLGCSDKIVSIGFLKVFKRERILTELEQHKDSIEVMTVLKGEVMLPVSEDFKEIKVFHLIQGDSVIINPGIWHYHPAAVNCESASLQIIFNKGTEINDLCIEKLSIRKTY